METKKRVVIISYTLAGAFLLILMVACSTEPQPLQYGQDACHFCKMTLVDQKFGAELVTRKGKVFKFDDIKCFLNYYHSGDESPENFEHELVIDYSNPGHLIRAHDSFYLKSENIVSPMAGELAAFEKKDSLDTFKKRWKGIYLVWGEVVTQFK